MRTLKIFLLLLLAAVPARALQGAQLASAQQGAVVAGVVRDETSAVLPGVVVRLEDTSRRARETATDAQGRYRFDAVEPGRASLTFSLVNFGGARRELAAVNPAVTLTVDVTLHLALSAEVVVTGRDTFANLADVENPAESLVGIAQSASQGAITARQLEGRPMMRTGEVLETVPGVVISQHSGDGKANQYYLRGFNLDHGTDFATTVAAMPVNMPTHAHGHGYSDLNFLIPELVSGVQFSKGPYFAEQGDFATAGAANINYVNALDRPIVRVAAGAQGFVRLLAAGGRRVANGWLLAAAEGAHSDGPWLNPDDFRKLNAVVRYTRGDSLNGLSVTGMGYRAAWQATDQVPTRAVASGVLPRFGALDPSDGGESARYSGSLEWQRTRDNTATRVSAYAIGYSLNLFSNFTYFLDDPINGDQFQQADRRLVFGGRVTQRRIGRWGGRAVQHTVGVQTRTDRIGTVGLYRTRQRARVGVVREDAVTQVGVGGFVENQTEWMPRLRTVAGLRLDGYRFDVRERGAAAGAGSHTGLVSPKAGVILGPFRGTELYANAGSGFHSNDARSDTSRLVRARGGEIGVRTVALRHLQSTITAWVLALDSELIFVGDAGATEAGRASRRDGIEIANYYRPIPWLTLDTDIAWSRARFTIPDPAGDAIPGAVRTVVSGGIAVDTRHLFGSVRGRYFGPRPLVEDGSVRSNGTSLVNLEAGYKLSARARIALDLFNLLDARDSDIDYFYRSRLPGEPEDGVDDVHFHPALPRTARVGVQVSF